MMSCDARRELCGLSADALAATDWGEPPVVVWDEAPHERIQERIVHTAKRVLELATDESDDLFLYLEDDVEFNTALRHNLEHWAPVAERRAGDFLFASLYNPNIVVPRAPDDQSPCAVADPRRFYGTQALVLSTATARFVLERLGRPSRPLSDIRMSRLATRRSPILFHRPSLVRHRVVPSTWGGETHDAVDFSPEWRA